MSTVDGTDLTQLTATELLDLYRKRATSPVEATQAVLDRIDALNPTLNAFCLVDADSALASARESEARWQRGEPMGALDGVPTSIKDLLLTRGWPTRRGSFTVDPDQPWDVDAPATARLREAGAVFVGKTTTPEFGCKGETNSPMTGITRNPWDPSKTSGGSSGGTASAVAAGLGAVEHRQRRRRLGAHPGSVLRELRLQGELRPCAGASPLAVRHGLAHRAAHDERGGRSADDERAEAARRARLDVAASRPVRLLGRPRRRHRRAAGPLLPDARLRPRASGSRGPRLPRRPSSSKRSARTSRRATRASTIRCRSRPGCGSPVPGPCGTTSRPHSRK